MRWLIAADGIFVLFRRSATRRKRGAESPCKGAVRPEQASGVEAREVKVGVVVPLDGVGRPLREDRWYVAQRAEAAPFRMWLRDEALSRGVRRKDTVAVVTDGAHWLRALRTRHFDWAVGVCDFYHAVEHLGGLASALHGEGSAEALAWQAEMAHQLKHEGAAAVVGEWKGARYQHPKDAERWRKEKAYFTGQLDAMDYPGVRAARLPIGSGSAEGGCRSVIGVRFKVPGARWSEEGFDNLLALRVLFCNRMPIGRQPP